MCLSAPVSFAAAAVLLPAGAYTVHTALKTDRRFSALAALPIMLGLQQFMEGMVWVTGASANPSSSEPYSLAYMFFAWIGWPLWLPLSAYFIEPAHRRTPYLVFALAGAMLGGVQFVPYLAHEGWLSVSFLEHAVRYSDRQLLDEVVGRPLIYLAYVSIIIVPLLLSSERTVKIFGGLVALVLAITLAFFQWAYVSVFCFGGAVASLYLIWALRGLRRPSGEAAQTAAA